MTSAPKSDKITAALGPAMKLARSTTFSPEKIFSLAMEDSGSRRISAAAAITLSSVWLGYGLASPAPSRAAYKSALRKGAEPGDGFADDQILHLVGPFVGVQRFGIREETCNLIIGDNTIAAKHFAGPCDGLAALRRCERLRERCMSICQLAFSMQLRLARDQTL